jgi:hypothetical protein
VTPEVLDDSANAGLEAGGGGCAQQGSNTPTSSLTLVASMIAVILARKHRNKTP